MTRWRALIAGSVELLEVLCAFGAQGGDSGPLRWFLCLEMFPVRDQDLLSVRRVQQRVMKFQFGAARLAGVTDN